MLASGRAAVAGTPGVAGEDGSREQPEKQPASSKPALERSMVRAGRPTNR
jgi:hypothetical protein